MALSAARLESGLKTLAVGVAVTATGALLLIKQIYVNLLHLPRGALNGAIAVVIGSLVVYGLVQCGRPRERGLSTLVLANLAIASCLLLISMLLDQAHVSQEQWVYAALRYALVPCVLLIPSLWRYPRIRAVLPIALLLIQIPSTLFALSEVAGFPFSFLRYDGWLYQKLYNGLPRATGGIGTQIDLGFHSVLFMCFWLSYGQLRSGGRIIAAVGFLLALVACIASFSRIYLMMAGLVCLIGLLAPPLRRWTLPLLCAAGLILLSVNLGGISGFVGDLLLSRDANSQSSNVDKEHTLRITADKADANDFWLGTGPGSQNGPTGTSKLIGDGFWPGVVLELGFVPALFVLAFEFAILVHLFFISGDSGAPMRLFAAGALINSTFNSPYAGITAVSLLFILSRYISGLRETVRYHT